MKPQPHTSGVLPWALLAVPVLYLAALLASGYEDGMTVFDLMGRFSTLLERPFAIQWTHHTPKFLLGALVLYGFSVVLFQSTRQNRRPGEEHGSAHWGDAKQLCRKYQDKNPENNVILTQHIRMSLNSRKHQRNLLQIVVGGSGSGKTRYVVKPNVYLANASYICTDPKGELARNTIPLLLRKGYVVKVFDLVDLERSDCYNPFRYIRSDADVLKLISNFIRNTTPKNAHSNDPFWEKSETALDCALMSVLRVVVNPAFLFQLPVQLLNVHSGDAGDDLAAQIGIDVAPDVLLVAAQGVGPQGDSTVLLHPAVQPLAQGHAAVLGELCVLVELHVPVELGQQFFLRLSQHIPEDGFAVLLVAHHDASFPSAIVPLAHHAVPGWSALSHILNPPLSFVGRPGLSPPRRRSTDRLPPVPCSVPRPV